MTADKGFEEVKEIIMFKAVWDEIDHQFSELSKEERHRIFSVIAPFITDMFHMAVRGGTREDIVKPDRKRKKRR